MDRRDAAMAYYETVDAGDYDRLRALLAPDFVQHRPDRTLDGPESFVRFMREERPRTDTEHVLKAVGVGGETTAASRNGGEVSERPRDDGPSAVFVEGRLRAVDGTDLFGFVDVHRVSDAGIESLRTYTD
ncbi:nuclear transport factor 2 family protein [Haloplanus natans]|uniref:nuclear transport factor 2 family protein n=1 Tax=Haloplanus natans TaxID=376171 RepID=UPI000677CCF0|nr:nuclear transport factor 2 family protein [Haloplanus natans]